VADGGDGPPVARLRPYDPTPPLHRRLFARRIHRDGAYIAEPEGEVAAFLAKIDATLGSGRLGAKMTYKSGLVSRPKNKRRRAPGDRR
jgi:hypothetical protein